MKLTFDAVRWSQDQDGYWLHLRVIEKGLVQTFVGVFKAGKHYVAELKEKRKHRSLDSNAYLWVLLDKLAAAIGIDKDELYLQVLERYGVFTHLIVKSAVVDRVKAEWRTVRELGEVTVNGQSGIQLQCYFGSSTYDTKEMARLIDGVVSECREVGIETMTPAELERMKAEWGRG